MSADIVDQLLGQFQIAQHPVARRALPARQMHLVDRDRRVDRVGLGPRASSSRRRPSAASPMPTHDRGIGGRMFRPETRPGRPSAAAARHPVRATRTCRPSPSPRPGMNVSHTPVAPRRRIGWRRPSQMLKSPTTDTRCAFGAQTAKCVPATPSCVIACAPSTCQSRLCVPSPSRYSSISPSTGPKRNGSSNSQSVPWPSAAQPIGLLLRQPAR